MKKNRNIKNILNINYLIITLVLVIIISFIYSYQIKQSKKANTEKNIYNQIETTGNFIQNHINKNVAILRSLVNTFSPIGEPHKDFTISREHSKIILKEFLKNNVQILDVYMLWEPNLFDGKDKQHILKENHDSSGRFIPHLQKDIDGSITQTYLKDYLSPLTAEYYFKTKKELTHVIHEPYIHRTKAQNIIKLPISAPILFGTRFLGVIGIDCSINNIQTQLNSTKLNEHTQILVITQKGKIVAASNKNLLAGKSIDKVFDKNSDEMYLKFRKSEFFKIKYKKDYTVYNKPLYLNQSEAAWNVCVITKTSDIENGANNIIFISIIITLLLLLLSVYIYSRSVNKITKIVRKTISNAQKLFEGDRQVIKNYKSGISEFNQLNKVFIDYSLLFDKIIQTNESVLKGNYHVDIEENNNSEIYRTLSEMIKALNKLNKEDKSRKEKEEILTWIRNGVANLNDSMRIGTSNIEELCDSVIQNLTKYMNASLGGIFMYQSDKKETLNLISSFAYDHKKAEKIKIQRGVGLVGTCALERSTIYMEKIPDDYIHITSGLGNASPKSLIVLPLIYNNELTGILELAFLRELKNYEKEFLEQISSNIASALITAKINARTAELLQRSQKQAEILERNKEKLSQNVNELEITQKKMLEREAEMKGLIEAVNNTIMTIEYTTEGILLNANDKYLNTMHYDIEELRGVNVLDLVKTERAELERVIKMVSKGEFYEKVMKRFTKFGEVRWLLSTYTPYYDVEGKITKVLYFAYDITESKERSEKLEQEVKQLKEKVQTLEQK